MIEDALRDITKSGWMLNNLMYLDNGLYRASLRNAEKGYEFGQDTTAEGALRAALAHAIAGNGEALREERAAAFIERGSPKAQARPKEKQKITLKDLGL